MTLIRDAISTLNSLANTSEVLLRRGAYGPNRIVPRQHTRHINNISLVMCTLIIVLSLTISLIFIKGGL